MIYTLGTGQTLSMAPARLPGPPVKNPKSIHDLCPGHRTNPKYGARAPPWPPSAKPEKLFMIYTPGTGLTLSMAPARLPGPQQKTLKACHDLYYGNRTNPKYGARAPPWPPSKKP